MKKSFRERSERLPINITFGIKNQSAMRSMNWSEKILVGKELFKQTKHCMLQAIILGAGSSKFFTKNTANIPVNCAKTVLDWQIDAFSGKDATFTFVGGSQIEHLSHEGSDVHFVFNPQ